MEYPLMTKRKKTKNKFPGEKDKRASIGADLHHLDVEKSITFDTGDYSKRRALRLTKKNNSWGFTLQTYGVKHKKTNEIEVMTYIDYVDIDGAAWLAGLRRGDVILAVNGEKVGSHTHKQLVSKIRQADDCLRLIVHFEDCCKKVELHERFLKLKAVLRSKIDELRDIELEERQILDKYYEAKGIGRFDLMRQSIISNVSSNSDSWDAYSVISSPYTHKSTGHFQNGLSSSVTSMRSLNIDEDSSIYEEGDIDYMDSDSESLSFTAAETPNSRSSDSDLVLKTTGLSDQDPRLSRSYDARLNVVQDDATLYKDADVESENVFMDEDHLVTFEATKKLYMYASGNPDLQKDSVNSDGVESEGDNVRDRDSVKRNESTNSDKIYYKGENGKMIVPKICVEGEAEYTTLDHIDTAGTVDNITDDGDIPYTNGILPELDMNKEQLQEKVVAIEIAREMARIEQMVENEDQNLVKVKKMNTKISKSLPKITLKNRAIQKVNSAMLNGGSDSRLKAFDLSPRLQRANRSHVGASLSYEKLKSSVPDILISFHAEDYQIIYINEGNQQTKL